MPFHWCLQRPSVVDINLLLWTSTLQEGFNKILPSTPSNLQLLGLTFCWRKKTAFPRLRTLHGWTQSKVQEMWQGQGHILHDSLEVPTKIANVSQNMGKYCVFFAKIMTSQKRHAKGTSSIHPSHYTWRPCPFNQLPCESTIAERKQLATEKNHRNSTLTITKKLPPLVTICTRSTCLAKV